MYQDSTPAELADMLDELEQFPHSTIGLSMLDEATLAYGSKYPEVSGPQRAFASARHAHMDSYRTETGNYTDESWRKAMEAAHALAAVLRPLGDARVARCRRQTGWGGRATSRSMMTARATSRATPAQTRRQHHDRGRPLPLLPHRGRNP